MFFPQQIQMALGLLTSITICACWWYAAFKKPGVPLFFWLATVRTVSVAISGATYFLITTSAYHRWVALSPLHTFVGMLEAVLYLLLVRWLVTRP